MNLLDKALEDLGIKYEDLSSDEKVTFNQSNFQLQNLTIDDVKRYVIEMKNSIGLQLANAVGTEKVEERRELILKARLQNYILLEAFLTSPEKAERALKNALSNIKLQKGK
jgi:hypothetical protein